MRLNKTTRRVIISLAVIAFGYALFAAGYYSGNRHIESGHLVMVERTPTPITETSALPDAGTLININTATLAELMTLRRIGPVLAGSIIEYRESIGGFTHTFELLDVKGIGESTYAGIKNDITVEELHE